MRLFFSLMLNITIAKNFQSSTIKIVSTWSKVMLLNSFYKMFCRMSANNSNLKQRNWVHFILPVAYELGKN